MTDAYVGSKEEASLFSCPSWAVNLIEAHAGDTEKKQDERVRVWLQLCAGHAILANKEDLNHSRQSLCLT